ncbi:MAG: hypothetical protein SFY66_22520 [Oculatellaceae cyanobacterium bins.114]|nr:hypothetical protein [Oculatellaceae cyanobacterium bins.114]
MKLTSISLLVTVTAIALTTAACNPQNATLQAMDSPMDVAQMAPSQMNPFEQLNLTAQQQSKIRKIREKSRQRIEQILTAEQRTEWQQAMQNPQRSNQVATLKLTSQQERQLQELLRSEQQQIFEVLTPSQREQLRQSTPPMRS